jgi:hypothetical protein
MSAATTFLARWIQLGGQHSPSVTVCSCQPSRDLTPGSSHYQPGIVSFGWGINGRVVRDGAGNGIGLEFGNVTTAFSDRAVNGRASWPEQQHFNNGDTDPIHYTFTVVDDAVRVDADLIRWGHARWSATTTQADAAGGQLYFPAIPGAGNGPTAVMLVSFQPSGSFGWL